MKCYFLLFTICNCSCFPMQRNQYQAILATSGNATYAILLYSTGNDEFNNNYASVGYYWLATNTSTILPGSQTCSIRHIASRSNVNVPGMFVFALDGTEQLSGNLINCSGFVVLQIQFQFVKREMFVWLTAT